VLLSAPAHEALRPLPVDLAAAACKVGKVGRDPSCNPHTLEGEASHWWLLCGTTTAGLLVAC
jgi:hypothetical protein